MFIVYGFIYKFYMKDEKQMTWRIKVKW
jgi:hypothetical protein